MRVHTIRSAVVAAVFTSAAVMANGAAAAAAEPGYEMPFPCGQAWKGETRSSHSPSVLAVDWNRTNDYRAPVVSSFQGTVKVANSVDRGGYGKYVEIDHGDGRSTLYAHMDRVDVRVGQKIVRGTRIGLLGTTGNSTGPHLHYEQRKGRTVVHPVFSGKKFRFGSTLTSKNCAAPKPQPKPEPKPQPKPQPTPKPEIARVGLSADSNGDSMAELGVYSMRDRGWFRFNRPDNTAVVVAHGVPGDLPVTGDWDGDGKDNVGVRTPSTNQFRLRVLKKITTITYGIRGDLPVAGDWDGNGTDEIGVWRPSTGTFHLRQSNGTTRQVKLGTAGEFPVTGDWNGDKITDLGVYNPRTATYTLWMRDDNGTGWSAKVTFGKAGDRPVTGDWNGDGRTDLGVWTPSTDTFSKRMAPSVRAPMKRMATERPATGAEIPME